MIQVHYARPHGISTARQKPKNITHTHTPSVICLNSVKAFFLPLPIHKIQTEADEKLNAP